MINLQIFCFLIFVIFYIPGNCWTALERPSRGVGGGVIVGFCAKNLHKVLVQLFHEFKFLTIKNDWSRF